MPWDRNPPRVLFIFLTRQKHASCSSAPALQVSSRSEAPFASYFSLGAPRSALHVLASRRRRCGSRRRGGKLSGCRSVRAAGDRRAGRRALLVFACAAPFSGDGCGARAAQGGRRRRSCGCRRRSCCGCSAGALRLVSGACCRRRLRWAASCSVVCLPSAAALATMASRAQAGSGCATAGAVVPADALACVHAGLSLARAAA